MKTIKNNLTAKDKALLEVLTDEYGYNEDELLENDCELLEELKEDYAVYTDEEADEECKNQILNLIEECGLESLNLNYEYYINDENSFFEDYHRDYYYDYANDIESEEADDCDYANRLEEEMSERGVNNIDDFVQAILDDIDDYAQEFKDNYDDDYFLKVLKSENLIDLDKMADDIMINDGRGNTLNYYDGIEHEITIGEETFYIYRQN